MPSETNNPMDKVSLEMLDMALRMCGIEINKKILDRVIDVVELLAVKGGKTTISDIENLKSEWRNQ